MLVLAPHVDDAELGCGGTIARLLEEGSEVYVTAFSRAEDSVPPGSPKDRIYQEFLASMAELRIPQANIEVFNYPVRRLSYHRQEILEDLVRIRRQWDPDLVIMPSSQDLHQDHNTVHMEGLRAFKHLSLLGYELPWNHLSFRAQFMMTLEQRHLEAKWNALSCYKSQFELGRQYFSRDLLLGVARLRGLQVRAQYAEAFEVSRIRA